ncbi:DUF2768 family protein [Paenibacillus methanolicus]|uniref:Uncharacterized protein DUF2768 n=1 Tax=Paenibacillus methanolicus TaxID=582686 RepID=A0A5S5CHS9_9BACL|nr:DUF2768 family protein [Paenibacillus methanolicus]TYP77776.1 uncharacterized protein DUF2768 [Paenibacillus methanolicus]
MDPMTKMWVSFIGIGLMAISAVLITVARYKLKGILKAVLSGVAFVSLILGALFGFISVA